MGIQLRLLNYKLAVEGLRGDADRLEGRMTISDILNPLVDEELSRNIRVHR